MRRIPFYLVAVAMLVLLANISSAQDRTFGSRRLLLDDGTLTPQGLVYITDNNGSMGVDNTGLVTGTFPSTCALLDLSSTTKGLLPPRMTGAQEAAICGGTPPFGMLVYNTSSNTLDLFSPLGWAPILGGVSWLLGGNSLLPNGGGTLPGQSFIGSNDATDFVIATSGVERARVIGVAGPNQGFVGINTVSPGSLLDVNGTFNSTGNSTVGSAFGTFNTMGDNGGASNNIGTGGNTNNFGVSATFNNVGTGSLQNLFGDNASFNDFGVNAFINTIGMNTFQNNFGTGTTSTNNFGSAGTSTNNVFGPTNINTSTNDATSIGSTGNASGVTIASNNATAITLNVANVANNLRLANIQAGSNADAAILDLTATPSGNVRTRTIGSLITGSNGVEVTYVGSSADAHFGPNNASVVFANGRFINTGTQVLSITGNSGGVGTTFASFNGNTDIVGINNNATNNGTTTIGNTTAGGIVSINSSVSTSRTSPTNSTLATGAAGNTMTASAGANALTGQTGNSITATTGNNTVTASTGANTITASGGNNNLSASALNALTGATGNTVTATTGNNVLTTNGAGQNNLVANGAGGQNNLSANNATGQNNITANVAGGSNNIVGATNINNNANFNTNITTGTSTGLTTIGSNVAGAVAIQSNASTAISLNVTSVLNNLQLGNIAVGSNGDAVFLDMTAATTGFVRTRTINSMITGSNGVEVTYPSPSLADAHLASANNTVLFTNDRFINTGGFTFHVTSGTPGTNDLITAGGTSVAINNTFTGGTNIGNVAGSVVNIGVGDNQNNFGQNATINFFGFNSPTNDFGTSGFGTNNIGAAGNLNNITGTTNTILGTTNINVTGGATTNIASSNAATTNVGTASGAVNNIGTGGGATTNTIGNSANLNTIGSNAVTNAIGTAAGTNTLGTSAALNQVGNSAATNQFGNNAGSNQFGANGGTNQFGLGSASNTLGTAGTSTNAINGTTNINTASAQLTTVGNGATGMHLLVNGLVDAVLTDGIGTPHWDFQVTGDAFVSGATRLVGAVLAGNQLTVTAGTTLNGGLVVNLGATINNGTTLNNGTTINNLGVAADNFMLTTPTNGGGVVDTRQINTLPFVGGQIPVTTQALGAAYAIAATDYLIICTNAGAGNVTLPAAAGAAGKVYVVKKTNGQVTVGSAGGTIDGAANFVMNGANQVAGFASDGANWFVVSN